MTGVLTVKTNNSSLSSINLCRYYYSRDIRYRLSQRVMIVITRATTQSSFYSDDKEQNKFQTTIIYAV